VAQLVIDGSILAMKTFAECLLEGDPSDFDRLVRYLRREDQGDRDASLQLQRELQDHVDREQKTLLHKGVRQCPLYTLLHSEIRHHIFSYIVKVPEAIHVYPVKGNPRLGYRLSRCPDALMSADSGICNCESSFSFRPPTPPPAYFDTELLLVSKTVRREALDLTFLHNTFTFTSIRDLANFTESFAACAAQMQNIRIYQRVQDHHLSLWAANSASKARARIGRLHKLELNCYLDDFNYYEQRYHDGFITEVIPLAFPRPEHVKVIVRPNRIWAKPAEDDMLESVRIVQRKLDAVFEGRWATAKEVPIESPPSKRVPESEKPPLDKRGILALGD
jgi:hypothetical protein